jgi:GntR family transcriptional regulator/MocR family aminotransferase
MAKRTTAAHLAALSLDPTAAAPLYRQLYFGIREAILAGQLQPGIRLPSTQTLARDLGLSRNTAVSAYEQLLAEGYLDGRVGAGSYVSRVLPEALLHARQLPQQRLTSQTFEARRNAGATALSTRPTATGFLSRLA